MVQAMLLEIAVLARFKRANLALIHSGSGLVFSMAYLVTPQITSVKQIEVTVATLEAAFYGRVALHVLSHVRSVISGVRAKFAHVLFLPGFVIVFIADDVVIVVISEIQDRLRLCFFICCIICIIGGVDIANASFYRYYIRISYAHRGILVRGQAVYVHVVVRDDH